MDIKHHLEQLKLKEKKRYRHLNHSAELACLIANIPANQQRENSYDDRKIRAR
jgi:hypothetical protein